MTELKEMAIELTAMSIINSLGSKVYGNRNWCIRTETTENNKIAYVGGFGQMKRRGFLSAFIKTIRERHIKWFEYTYKKDYLSAIDFLENNGYTIITMK